MSGRYKAYPKYKNSGVEWLSEVPEHWRVRQLKYLCSYNDEVLPDSVNTDYEIEYVDIGSVSATAGITNTENITFGDAPSRARRIVRDGDVIISTVRTYLEAISSIDNPPDNLIVSTGFAVIRPNSFLKKGYAAYCLRANGFIKEVIARSVGVSYPAINATDLVNIKSPEPSLDEQEKIVKFLDYETAKIDALIDKQQQLIQLLKEKRQAVFSHAVTKRLNPDAPMRDSGVEWLGEVPAHWKVKQIKHICSLSPKKSEIENQKQKECNFVPMEKLKTDTVVLDEVRVISDVYDGYTYFKDEDILMAKVTPCFENKNIAIAKGLKNGIGFGSTEIYVLRVNHTVMNRFLYYRLQEDGFIEAATAAMAGAGGLKRVPSDIVSNFKIAVPLIEEQEEIVLFINNYIIKFDVLVLQANKAISLMQERRTALISAAVTGKIDVRHWQASGPSIHTQHETLTP